MKPDLLKLYHFPATRSARARWILHESVGDGFEIVPVDLYGGMQYAPDYLRMNPNHNVPVLEISWEDGRTTHMLESAAMVALLADAYPEKKLAPQAAEFSPERADYLQMLHFGGSWMDMMLWQIRIHEHILPEAEADARTVARYRNKMAKEVEPQLLARLEKHEFICGDAFTAADCVIGHNVTWARGYGMCQQSVFRSYLSRLSKRPAFQKAFADAKEFKPSPSGGRPERTNFTG
ncbi:glutathione S-transferase family protein [Hyphococcus flavus]|uniref:Glutathione S-transferase family protein n=1 Tax=Hyphococcus flavus TaxID=1866326 RepID=A0AAF0CGK6_9PROT|nr:glutathione S-transferase family protein [Hyphococcus flavus]WDI32293.1 glutathione S-transferase family protein [Hyphococcus flavus]